MNKKSPLLSYEDNWETELGAFIPGESVVIRGKNLFEEFSKKPWIELLLFSITSRSFSDNQLKLFEGIWNICTSYPDPRLWNNRVGALAGTVKSTGSLGLAAATAVTEASIYGMRPIIKSFNLLIKTEEELKNGSNLNEFIKKELKFNRVVPGYGRPIVNIDERIEPLMRLADSLGLGKGKYIELAFIIEKAIQELGYRMNANIAVIAAGLVADQGLTAKEYYYYLINSFTVGIIACNYDASEKNVGTLLPLNCGRILYLGEGFREW